MSARYIVGDSLAVLRSMPAASVDLALSSPPFLGLRSYLPADHPDKAAEMGSEATPGAFIDALLDIVEECRRVLAPHGSLCFELGDTYAGSGGGGGDYNDGGWREAQQGFAGSAKQARVPDVSGMPPHRHRSKGGGIGGPGWPLDKSLCLVPELLRVAMVYGFNPLTGRTTPRWRARNVVRWCRPNPPVGALADKVRPATSDMLIACVGRKRYFDLDAVRTPTLDPNESRQVGQASASKGISGGDSGNADKERPTHNPAGAPPLDHWWHDEPDRFVQDGWLISTEPYKGSHYATWPTDLLVRPIEAMCPRKVCTACGRPSERTFETSFDLDDSRPQAKRAMELASAGGLTTEHLEAVRSFGISDAGKAMLTNTDEVKRLAGEAKAVLGGYFREFTYGTQKSAGWTDCGHESWRRGIVLDPFAGSGTTAVVALGHGRDFVGIDLDARNADLARERVGMWLEVEHHQALVAD